MHASRMRLSILSSAALLATAVSAMRRQVQKAGFDTAHCPQANASSTR